MRDDTTEHGSDVTIKMSEYGALLECLLALCMADLGVSPDSLRRTKAALDKASARGLFPVMADTALRRIDAELARYKAVETPWAIGTNLNVKA